MYKYVVKNGRMVADLHMYRSSSQLRHLTVPQHMSLSLCGDIHDRVAVALYDKDEAITPQYLNEVLSGLDCTAEVQLATTVGTFDVQVFDNAAVWKIFNDAYSRAAVK